ncbi:MAG: Holliday junction branch migration protein RuvA [Planctomycetota bacterium]
MIERIRGTLCRLGEADAAVEPLGSGLWHRVMLPAYVRAALEGRAGEPVDLATLEFLDSPNQGATMVPRMIGFETDAERAFFERFTTVKGLGPKKALRALVEPPGAVAEAIARRDAKWLQRLPEIGKRLAETIIAELHGKLDEVLVASLGATLDAAAGGALGPADEPTPGPFRDDGVAADAVSTLLTLGETKPDAERLIARARADHPDDDLDALVAHAYELRGAIGRTADG